MRIVDDLMKRAINVAGRASGNIVSPAVSALCTLAGVATGRPELATIGVPVGALAGALTEEAAGIVGQVWRDRQGRVEHLVGTAEEEAGQPIEELINAAMAEVRLRELLTRSVEAAARSLDDWKIDLLAATFVRGVQDDAIVDDALLLVEAIRQLENPHMRFLRVLATVRQRAIAPPEPGGLFKAGVPRPDRRPASQWLGEDILREDPGLELAFDSLSSKLQGLGLVSIEGNGRARYETYYELTRMGHGCTSYLQQREKATSQNRGDHRTWGGHRAAGPHGVNSPELG